MRINSIIVPVIVLIVFALTGGCDDVGVDDGGNVTASKFTVFRTEDGLADNAVTDVLVDYIRNGVWFTTRSGLSFYSITDSTFVTYGAEYDIPDMEMTSLAVDYSGTIWAGTVTGLSSMAPGDTLWTSLPDRDNLVHRYITSLAPVGFSLWIGTKGGISIRNPDGWKSYVSELGFSSEVTSVAEDTNGNVWVGSTDGIAVLADSVWKYYDAPTLPTTYINTIYADIGGSIWVGTSSIASLYQNGTWKNYGPADGLPATGINTFKRDKFGVLWAGTNSGVYYFINDKWINFAIPSDITGPPVRAIDSDQRTGTMWFGTDQGVLRYEPSTLVN